MIDCHTFPSYGLLAFPVPPPIQQAHIEKRGFQNVVLPLFKQIEIFSGILTDLTAYRKILKKSPAMYEARFTGFKRRATSVPN